MSFKQIIRWAGSKKKLVPFLLDNVPHDYERYIEPFCGSACLFFELNPDKALLCDINPELINVFNLMRNSVDFYDDLVSIPATKEEYYRIRELNVSDMSEKERAVRFLYLNRYCFNGVYRTNKAGKFNVPWGSKTGSIPSKSVFEYASSLLLNAEIRNLDYKKTAEEVLPNDFVYLDPPYSKSGRFTGEYGVGSLTSDETPNIIKVLDKFDKQGTKFMLSYLKCDGFINSLPSHYKVKELTVKRHVAGFKTTWGSAQEILVKNYD